MAKQEYTAQQKKIITNYYHHLDSILLSRLQEMVSQLYLAETERQRRNLWNRVEKALVKMNIPEPVRTHILERKDVQTLAKNLEEWLRLR